MSVSRASSLKILTPSGSWRLSVMPRLLRCRFWKSKPWRAPPMPSPVRPPGISILMAFAPQSTSWRTQVGPARARVRSRTLKRARGSEPLPVIGHIPPWPADHTAVRSRARERDDDPRRDVHEARHEQELEPRRAGDGEDAEEPDGQGQR